MFAFLQSIRKAPARFWLLLCSQLLLLIYWFNDIVTVGLRWLYEGMIKAALGVWVYLWGFLTFWIGTAITACLDVIDIPAVPSSTFLDTLRTINWFIPIEYIMLLLPAWLLFEVSCFGFRIAMKAWR